MRQNYQIAQVPLFHLVDEIFVNFFWHFTSWACVEICGGNSPSGAGVMKTKENLRAGGGRRYRYSPRVFSHVSPNSKFIPLRLSRSLSSSLSLRLSSRFLSSNASEERDRGRQFVSLSTFAAGESDLHKLGKLAVRLV